MLWAKESFQRLPYILPYWIPTFPPRHWSPHWIPIQIWDGPPVCVGGFIYPHTEAHHPHQCWLKLLSFKQQILNFCIHTWMREFLYVFCALVVLGDRLKATSPQSNILTDNAGLMKQLQQNTSSSTWHIMDVTCLTVGATDTFAPHRRQEAVGVLPTTKTTMSSSQALASFMDKRMVRAHWQTIGPFEPSLMFAQQSSAMTIHDPWILVLALAAAYNGWWLMADADITLSANLRQQHERPRRWLPLSFFFDSW